VNWFTAARLSANGKVLLTARQNSAMIDNPKQDLQPGFASIHVALDGEEKKS